MLLNEFFGAAIDTTKQLKRDREESNQGDELFWYIIDHDRLHKDYFFPIAQHIHKNKKNLDREAICKEFMPMVVKGCKEFYKHNDLKGNMSKMFTEELRNDLCERLYDHYKEDILKGRYKLGA
jgi:hypothetical protein